MAPRLNIKGVPLLPLWDSVSVLGRTLPFPFTNPSRRKLSLITDINFMIYKCQRKYEIYGRLSRKD